MTEEDILRRLRDPARLKALVDSGLAAEPPSPSFDRLTKLAARLFGVPTAVLSLVEDTQTLAVSGFLLGENRTEVRATSLTHSFCKHVAAGKEVFRIDDARVDPRVRESPAVSELGVIAYLGVPVSDVRDETLGAFCVLDDKPRHWTDEEVGILRDFAAAAAHEIDLGEQLRRLRRSERIHRILVQNLPRTSVLLFDHELRYVAAEGAAFLSQFNLAHDQMVGQLALEVAAPANRAALGAQYRAALAGQETHRTSTRAGRTFELHTAPVRDDHDQIVGGVAMTYDLTDLTTALAGLRQKSGLVEGLVAAIDDRVTVLDAVGQPLLKNEAARARPDLSPEETFLDDEGTPCPPGELPLAQALRGVRVPRRELYVERLGALGPEGHWESVSAAPLRDAEGNVFGALSLARDSSAERAAAAELRVQSNHLTLLTRVAQAADPALGLDRAVREILRAICSATGWPLAHLYLPHGDLLAPSDVWVAERLARFQAFVDASMQQSYAPGETTVGEVAASGEIRWSPKLEAEPSFRRDGALRAVGLSAGLFLPVALGNEGRAVVEFFSGQGAAPSPALLEVLRCCAQILGRVFEGERLRLALDGSAQELRELAMVDDLTGLCNRHGFLVLAEQQLRAGQRSQARHQLVYAAMEGLGALNESQGQRVGDQALRDMALVFRRAFRGSDIVGRLSGDSFVALAADTGQEGRERILARLGEQLAAFNAQGHRPFQLTARLGAAPSDPANPRSVEDLLADADRQLRA